MMKWFDNIYVINLDSRKDRLERVTREFERIGCSFERFPAVDGDTNEVVYVPNDAIPGWNKNSAALLETTIRIIKDAQRKAYNCILICEDDVFFSTDAKERLDALRMPDMASWDMFFFGVMHIFNPQVMNKDIVRLTRSMCCHCYAIQSRVYEDYIQLLEMRDRPIDWITTDFFQIHGRCLALREPLAFQKPDYSNIRKKHVCTPVSVG